MKEYFSEKFQEILGIEYDMIKTYFQEIRDAKADFAIFITRRCFILYHVIALIESWGTLEKTIVISDRGIWANREKLKTAKLVIASDDILWHGQTLTKVVEKLRKYTTSKCKIVPYVYCKYDQSENKEVKFWCVKDKFACNQLSDRFVRCITENGIPYSTFVYPYYGKSNSAIINRCEQTNDLLLVNEPLKLVNNAWKQYYDFNIPSDIKNCINNFSKSCCLRIYQDDMNNYACIMPFSFLYDIKQEYIREFFVNLKDILVECNNTISQEIEDVLNYDKDTHNAEQWVYLMTMLSCLLSIFIGIEMNIGNWFKEGCFENIARISIQGCFPLHVTDAFMRMDKTFSTKFKEKVINSHVNWKQFYILESNNNEKRGNDMQECFYEMTNLFQDHRMKYEHTLNSDDKSVSCNKITEDFSSKFSNNVIYASQISCWDQGIAGYMFEFVEKEGIKSRNIIGERSSLIISLRYFRILDQYFTWETQTEGLTGNLSIEERKSKLQSLMEEGKVREVDQTLLLQNIDQLYQYYII